MVQKQETKKKKKKKKEYRGNPNNPLYKSKKFLDKLDEYYTTYERYDLTADKLNEDFDTGIAPNTVSKLYKKHIAIKFSDDKKAKKFFENSFIRMQKRWEDAWEMIGDLVSEYKRLKKAIRERDEDELTQAITFMKMSSQIVQITTEIRKQLEFIRKQQEEIKIYQQNNLIVSPVQIKKEINNHFKNMSKKEIQLFFKSLDDDRFAEFTRKLEDDE